MFETLKHIVRALTRWINRGVDLMTCHHCLYAYLGVVYYLGCVGIIGKDTVAELATAIYFALSARG